MSDALFEDLTALVGAARVSRETTERMIYARDLWPLHTIRLRTGVLPPSPGMVTWPESEEEVIAIIKLARRHRIPLTPYGGGSGVLGGAMPSPGGLIMDLKRMGELRSIDPVSSTCEVDPGILGQHLEDRLNERGYTLGHFPSSLMTASVGGYVATRSAGQFSSRYGKIEDMVVSMRFVTGTGEILDTAKESLAGGPDFNQIFLGSEGTLGIVTRVTLKVYPSPATADYRGFRFPRIEDGFAAMRHIMQAGLRPSVMRLYDELDTFLVGRGDKPLDAHLVGGPPTPAEPKGDETRRSGGRRTLKQAAVHRARSLIDRFPQVARGAVRMALGRPALIESLSHRLLPNEVLLILGSEGEPEEVEATMAAMLEVCRAAGAQDLGPGPGLRWLKKRYDVSFKMPQYFHYGAFVDTIEVASTWDRIPSLYHSVRAAVGDTVMIMAHFSHAYPEGASIYFSLGGSGESWEDIEKRYLTAWERAMEVVLRHGATVSHHHGVGLMKAPFAAREHAGFLPLFRTLKARLDPDGILNPGKLYGDDGEPPPAWEEAS